MDVFSFKAGTTPLLVSMPHAGTHIPPAMAARMTPAALTLADTDWHLERLYDFLGAMGASVLVATHSRYVVDLNRPQDDANLYPGQDTTGLFPVDTFAKEPVYRDGMLPDAAEQDIRREKYWRPYHAKIATTLDALRAQHGYALLWEAHSIASLVPRFFDGRLPDFNIGTANGTSCGAGLSGRLAEATDSGSVAVNGRFKGGYITRQYGQPGNHVHAVQLELSQATYMHERAPFDFDESKANSVRPALRRMLENFLDWGAASAR